MSHTLHSAMTLTDFYNSWQSSDNLLLSLLINPDAMESGDYQIRTGYSLDVEAPKWVDDILQSNSQSFVNSAEEFSEKTEESSLMYEDELFYKAAVPGKGSTRNVQQRKRKQKEATCSICQQTFIRKYEMMRHLKATHLQLKPYRCTECPKTFARNSHRTLHWRNIHMKHARTDIRNDDFN